MDKYIKMYYIQFSTNYLENGYERNKTIKAVNCTLENDFNVNDKTRKQFEFFK